MLGWKGNHFPKEKPRHLYLLSDEWARGYSIRKIDLLVGDGNGEYSLPPALFRFEAPHGSPKYFAGAFDSKIFAMHPTEFSFNPKTGFPIYDVRERSLMVGPWQRPDPVDPIYIPVGGRLFALAVGSFQVLYPPQDESDESDSEDDNDDNDAVWNWHTLPDPPFETLYVSSYGVHRDGKTIFVSIPEPPTIFSFDTAESTRDDSMWKLDYGRLPFSGRAYFVAELDAWVGLSSDNRNSWRICSADLEHGQAVKYCEVLNTSEELVLTIGATLVSLGGNKFCIVEGCLDREPGLATFVRLVTFSLMYDGNGELTTANSCQFRKYKNVPREVGRQMLQTPVAFWM